MFLLQVSFILILVSLHTHGQQCKFTRQSEYGYALLGNVYNSFIAARLAVCYSVCNTQPDCQSLNYNLADNTCYLNKETKASSPENCARKGSFVYAENPDRALLGSVSTTAAKSCQHVAKAGDSVGNGEYWIDPEGNGNPFKVFCDMTTDGGGWLLVANFVMESDVTPPNWNASESTIRGISNHNNNRMGITKSAMNQLRAHAQFNQIRFHFSKKSGTTFHVKTTLDNKGDAVVQYFSGQTDILPGSCNSFTRLEGDTSRLATQCDRWGNDDGHHVGKWGHWTKTGDLRMYDHAAFVALKYHWIATSRWECDDSNSEVTSGDFWKIYVR